MATQKEIAEQHHATISLLQAMYPIPGELVLSPWTQEFLDDPTACSLAGETLEFELNITPADSAEDAPLSYSISLTLPPASGSTKEGSNPRCAVYLRQPPALTRAEHADVLARIPPHTDEIADDGEYILEILATIPGAVEEIVQARPIAESSAQAAGKAEPLDDGPLERVWFWFPTLSSKEKRRDIVEYAREAGLTGFVLAGKPALLCVEGGGNAVDRYMARIKSESWSDIPSGHKKVTERLRLPLSAAPAPPPPSKRNTSSSTSFPSPAASPSPATSTPSTPTPATPTTAPTLYRQLPPLIDISDEISRYGTYAHRAEMSEVRKIVDRWGVGEEMGRVLMM